MEDLKKRYNERDLTLTLEEIAELSEFVGIELIEFPDFKYRGTGLNKIG
jgi:hypothetical protein